VHTRGLTGEELLRQERATFRRLEDRQLWYAIGLPDGEAWEFPVPLPDTLGDIFLSSDEPVRFARWVHRHILRLRGSTVG
jgi:hypothetical protein